MSDPTYAVRCAHGNRHEVSAAVIAACRWAYLEMQDDNPEQEALARRGNGGDK